MEQTDVQELRRRLQDDCGLDLSHYSDPFLDRRIQIRLRQTGKTGLNDYLMMLSQSAEERQSLLEALSINVTTFFRDIELSEESLFPVFTQLLARPGFGYGIRAWSAGCATGQEPYTLAMVLDRYATQSPSLCRTAILATDLNEEHLKIARQGVYTKQAAAAIPENYRADYLDEDSGSWRVRALLKQRVQFQKHDLALPPPLWGPDLIVCRNVMIYFNAQAKTKILANFYRSLTPGGFLILGSAEVILESNLFRFIGKTRKIYQRLNSGQEAL